jgi:N-acylneuraminate cytidylyltransferase
MKKEKSMEVLAIIPARGGSKGIPGKNLAELAGRPLISYMIESALGAKSISRLVVSTDDESIAEVSRENGAEVVMRPPEISGDEASSESALLHTLAHLKDSEGYKPELVVFLQCTSPLTTSEDIDGTVAILLKEEADSALAVTPFHYFLWDRGEDGAASPIGHDKDKREPRQSAKEKYLETGAVYVMRSSAFIDAAHRFFGKTAMYVMPRERCLEIDEPVDLALAETLMRSTHPARFSEVIPKTLQAVVFDFDGVFTDNRVIVSEDGKESVVCDRGDGLGLEMLRESGMRVMVLSKEKNPVVQARCEKLGIECVNGIDDKRTKLTAILKTEGIDAKNVIYVGNDVNDLECMRMVGCAAAPSDSHPEALRAAAWVLSRAGGKGAVRELCDELLRVNK